MAHYLLELAIWLLGTFLFGCVIGTILRRVLRATGKVKLPSPGITQRIIPKFMQGEHQKRKNLCPDMRPWHRAGRPNQTSRTQSEVDALQTAPAAIPLADEPASAPRMPVGISGPRNGRPDALQRISGVGPKNEQNPSQPRLLPLRSDCSVDGSTCRLGRWIPAVQR